MCRKNRNQRVKNAVLAWEIGVERGDKHKQTNKQTGILRDEAPVAGAMLGNVGRKLVVFLRGPLPPLHIVLLTTWDPTHLKKKNSISN